MEEELNIKLKGSSSLWHLPHIFPFDGDMLYIYIYREREREREVRLGTLLNLDLFHNPLFIKGFKTCNFKVFINQMGYTN